MTPEPRKASRGTTVRAAIQLMEDQRIRHLLVMDDEKLVGIVSRRELDLLTMVGGFDPDRTAIEMAMTPDPFQVPVEMPLQMVAMQMAAAKVGSAVVVERGVPVGIFTTIDALMALSDLAPKD